MVVNKVFDANVYINDASTHGMASEVSCPEVSAKMDEYPALGMYIPVSLPNGIEAMELSIKWTMPSNEVMIAMANSMQAVDLAIFSSKAVFNNSGKVEEQKIAINVRGFPKKHQGGSFKAREDSEFENTIAVFYYRIEVNGQEIMEVDAMNNIYTVDGVDMLEQRKANLGI